MRWGYLETKQTKYNVTKSKPVDDKVQSMAEAMWDGAGGLGSPYWGRKEKPILGEKKGRVVQVGQDR